MIVRKSMIHINKVDGLSTMVSMASWANAMSWSKKREEKETKNKRS